MIFSSGFGASPSENFRPEKKHPNHKMEVSFIPKKKVFKVGETVEVTLVIKNIGENVFSFQRGGRQRGKRDNQFAFTAEMGDVLPDIGSPFHRGGLASNVVLKPGEKIEIPVVLNNWFRFEREGLVFLRGSYYMEFQDPDDYTSFIWEDFACAEFTITIGETGEQ
jgi:hypothetical protein